MITSKVHSHFRQTSKFIYFSFTSYRLVSFAHGSIALQLHFNKEQLWKGPYKWQAHWILSWILKTAQVYEKIPRTQMSCYKWIIKNCTCLCLLIPNPLRIPKITWLYSLSQYSGNSTLGIYSITSGSALDNFKILSK